MQKKQIKVILKWGTVIPLAFSAVIFFLLPYGYKMSGLQVVQSAFEYQFNKIEWIVEAIIRFVIPVMFTVLSALIMLKYSVKRCVYSTVFCGIAAAIYVYVLNHSGANFKIGFILNVIIAFIGVILSIANIVFRKIYSSKK